MGNATWSRASAFIRERKSRGVQVALPRDLNPTLTRFFVVGVGGDARFLYFFSQLSFRLDPIGSGVTMKPQGLATLGDEICSQLDLLDGRFFGILL